MDLSVHAHPLTAAPSGRDPRLLSQVHWAALWVLGAVAVAGAGFAIFGFLGFVRMLGVLALAGSGFAGLLLVFAMRSDPELWNAFRNDGSAPVDALHAGFVRTRQVSIRWMAKVIYGIRAQLKYAEWRYARYRDSSSRRNESDEDTGFALVPASWPTV